MSTRPSLASFRPAALLPALALVLLLLSACETDEPDDAAAATDTTTADTAGDAALCPHSGDGADLNALSEAEQEAGWQLLFDGSSFDGWRGYQGDAVTGGWAVTTDGLLSFAPQDEASGDIITDEQYGRDFVLSLEWRLNEGGNSGVFYWATEEYDRIWKSAPEMQILDNERHPDAQYPSHQAGALYDLYVPTTDATRAPGAWNSICIASQDGRVEHWLNGQKVVEYDVDSDDYQQRFEDSKFSEFASYAQAEQGHFGLQDHGDPVWYRNIKVRPLD